MEVAYWAVIFLAAGFVGGMVFGIYCESHSTTAEYHEKLAAKIRLREKYHEELKKLGT